MIPVIPAVDPKFLKKELTKDRFLRPTNKAHNEIYIIDSSNAPHVMMEIGRLRELSFRLWGGGSGAQLDTDEYDYLEKPYKQLIVWNPDSNEIVGGYRFLNGADAAFDEQGQPQLTMRHLFTFSDTFIQEYLPYTIELGRAFVQPKYQSSEMGMKSLFALDNLWDGLGALIHESKNAKYFIGKVTIYQSYSAYSRDLVMAYLRRYCPDPDRLIYPNTRPTPISEEHLRIANAMYKKRSATESYKALQKAVRADNQAIPPLINAYVELTETMRSFGTIYDPTFGNVFETGIMITIPDLLDAKQQRYIEPYVAYLRIILEEKKQRRQKARAHKKEAKDRLERSKKTKEDRKKQ